MSTWAIEWHAELDSTMTRARELAVAGAPPGTVVVADYQSAGRGTQGRSWSAPPGSCLMFTLVANPRVRDATELGTLPRLIANSLVGLLDERFGLRAEIKEPNDILIGGRKLCGILCLSHLVGDHASWVICGIGLNTTMTTAQLPIPEATSLALEGVTVPPHPELLELLLARLTWLL